VKKLKYVSLLVTSLTISSCTFFYKSEINDTITNKVIEYENKIENVENDFLSAEYDYIFSSNGYAVLQNDGENIVVDKNGEVIFSTKKYDISAVYKELISVKSLETSLHGLIAKDGNIIIKPQYEESLMFTDDLAIVGKNKKLGFINMRNELVIDYEYEWAMPFTEGIATVGIGNEFWFINTEGDILGAPYEIIGTDIFRFPAFMEYSEGYTAYFEHNENVFNSEFVLGVYWGFLDRNGDVAIPAKYLTVNPFKEGLALVQTQNHEWVYIDKDDNIVLETGGSNFSENLAYYENGFIDKNGNVVFKLPKGYRVNYSVGKGHDTFNYGMIVAYKEDDNGISFCVINTSGDAIKEIDITTNINDKVQIINENFIAVKKDDKWKLVFLGNEKTENEIIKSDAELVEEIVSKVKEKIGLHDWKMLDIGMPVEACWSPMGSGAFVALLDGNGDWSEEHSFIKLVSFQGTYEYELLGRGSEKAYYFEEFMEQVNKKSPENIALNNIIQKDLIITFEFSDGSEIVFDRFYKEIEENISEFIEWKNIF